MRNASDEALVAGYAAGDPDAAAVFVRRFQAKAFGLALHITGDRAEAHDAAQDAFVRAWRYAGSYDPRRGPVARWLLGIVRNVALDRVRLRGRRGEQPLPELASLTMIDPAAVDVDDALGVRDDAARIIDSMRVLPVEQREALLAVTLGGLSAREFGERAGLPLGTVKTRVRLALRKLRDRLGVEVE
jgi:RNA polymerase sigma-70 factor (ECF subfamily)